MFVYYLANQMSGEDICEIIINNLKQKGSKQQKPSFFYISEGKSRMLNPSIKQLYVIILILKDSCTVRRFAGKLPHPNIIFCSEVEHCCWSEGFCFTHEKESIEMVPTRLGSTAEQCKLNNVESKRGLRPGERHRPCQQETWLCRKYVSCEAARQ